MVMEPPKSVIVTMYFNLRELADVSRATRPIEFYLKAGQGTLQLDYPMVIFCDATTRPLIQRLRDELIGPNSKTIYIEKPLAEYDLYKINWPIIRENRIRRKRNPEDRNTCSYYLTCMFKIQAMKIAEARDDFAGTHYFWVDFGCSHIAHSKTMKVDAIRMLESPKSKVAALLIRYWTHAERENLIETVEQGTCGMAGTVFSIEKAYVARFYSAMLSVFYELLFKEAGHTDEQVMTICYYRWPELFNLCYGDYYSVISNYHDVINDWHTTHYHVIDTALRDNNRNEAKKAARAIEHSVTNGRLSIADDDLSFIKSLTT